MTNARSAVWDHFVKLDNAMECQLCPAEKRQPLAGTNAGNAKKHLRHIHPAQFRDVASRDARRFGNVQPSVTQSFLTLGEPTTPRGPTVTWPAAPSHKGLVDTRSGPGCCPGRIFLRAGGRDRSRTPGPTTKPGDSGDRWRSGPAQPG